MQNQFADTYLYNPVGKFATVLAHLQKLLYIILIFRLLIKYKKILVENYSISDDYNYKWLMQMNIFISVLFVIAIIKNSQKYGNTNEDLLPFRLAVATGMLIFTCWLVLKALYAPKIFTGINSKLLLNQNKEIDKIEENSNIHKKVNQLKMFMQEKRPFFDSDFTIQKLSEQTQIDTREISSILNHHLNQNFYEFVNQYRIEESKKILLHDKKKTILEVLYQVGYNSKSTFNAHFKKSTGYTPTEFRKNHN
ncbi:helix-turn-helix domain-containing protein [uncultured Polaribacter sp.]|uniref:helix-turn-helix domain-containing protein n=1 Tax=uncultured Polaribacter sp. TaxID=174711 RepID=UPI00260B1747|nr:helix-turn-helix domain-containing protein [uncultured Polaribacter sp.]